MSERDIRASIERICGKLDRHARAAGRSARGVVFPFVLGAGVAVTACSEDSGPEGMYSAPDGGGTTTSSGTGGAAGEAGSGGAGGGAGGEAGAGGASGGMGGDAGATMEYMAPDA